jgi:hypothetical protein
MQFSHWNVKEPGKGTKDAPLLLDGLGRSFGELQTIEILRNGIHQSPYWGYSNNIVPVIR